MEFQLKIIGILLIALAAIHIVFPKYFNWSKELDTLSLINRQMMYVHTFFIALTVFLMGVLCLTYSNAILETELGKIVALGFGLFWITRLIIQFWGYSSALWKGKTFETVVHISFTFLWTYLSTIFIWTYLN